jgi:hypothetical protein
MDSQIFIKIKDGILWTIATISRNRFSLTRQMVKMQKTKNAGSLPEAPGSLPERPRIPGD